MRDPWFVDVHSHVVPSLDDGARTVDEAVELCRLAAESGTAVLFATPHMHAPGDSYPWTDARARLFDESFPLVRERSAALGIDLRRGVEVYPSEVHDRDPVQLRLEGTDAVLLEFPGWWLTDPGDVESLVAEAGQRVEASGLTPVFAHPERCRAVVADRGIAARLAERGWLLCLNAPSLTGGHGETARRVGWQLLEDGVVGLVASDGHRAARPPALDLAYEAVVAGLGERSARPLFNGASLPWHAGCGPAADARG